MTKRTARKWLLAMYIARTIPSKILGHVYYKRTNFIATWFRELADALEKP